MDLMQLSDLIMDKVKKMEICRRELSKRAEDKAKAISAYDKKLAQEIMKAKEEHPTTICEKIAKGECFQARLDMELSEAMYKSLTTALSSLQAELNGLQSISKYQKEV